MRRLCTEAEAADLVFLDPDGDAIAAISNDRSTSIRDIDSAARMRK